MDVTAEILRNHLIYGASENTAPNQLSSSRALNYAAGPSITRPDHIEVQLIPFTLKYQDSVGLFGAENYFVKVTVKLDPRFTAKCFEEEGWECGVIRDKQDTDSNYDAAIVDPDLDLTTVNTYEPVNLDDTLTTISDSYIEVDLRNLKTGNIYVDSWLDTRLYTSDREEHPYDRLYIRENDTFYIGVHARNTRQLPYNIECIVGSSYVSKDDIPDSDRRYIAKTRR